MKKEARARRYTFWASVNRASLRGVVMTRRCSRGKNKPRQQAQLEAERMTRKSELIVGDSPTTITEIWLTLAPRRLRMAVQRSWWASANPSRYASWAFSVRAEHIPRRPPELQRPSNVGELIRGVASPIYLEVG